VIDDVADLAPRRLPPIAQPSNATVVCSPTEKKQGRNDGVQMVGTTRALSTP
jgi:hypothetical protein